jgi:tyrosinase
VQNTQPARANIPLEVPLSVDRALVSAVVRRPQVSAGDELLNFPLTREATASRPQALAFLREIDATNDQSTQFRVFLNCDYLSQSTPISDDHFVGTFGFFGNEGHATHSDGNPSVLMDLSGVVESVTISTPAIARCGLKGC